MLMGYSKGSASGPAPSSMCGWSGRGGVPWCYSPSACGLGVHALVLLAAAWLFMPRCQSRLSGRARTAWCGRLCGGICTIRAATRRRHAGRMFLMVQNPHLASGVDGSQGSVARGCPASQIASPITGHVCLCSSRWPGLWPPRRCRGPRISLVRAAVWGDLHQ